MSREIEDRLRAALAAKADQIGETDLSPSQLPVETTRSTNPSRFRRSVPWLAPVLAVAAVVVVIVAVTQGAPDRHSGSTNSAASSIAPSAAAPVAPAPASAQATATPSAQPPATSVPSASNPTEKSLTDAASAPATAFVVPGVTGADKLKILPSAVLGSTAYWPGGNTRGFGNPHPSELNTNGDPSGIVLGITWNDWGSSTATGLGRTYLPKPGGGYYPGTVPIQLQATKLGRCGSQVGYGQLYYRTPTQPGGSITGPWQLWANATNLCTAR
jgi:hypothetical protein